MPETSPASVSAEIVAVGSELLLGEIVDTNSAWISARFAEIGVDVFRHTTVGDNVARMTAVLAEACSRAQVVVVSGGLGPTADDLTRVAVAKVAGVPLRRRDDLVASLRQYFARSGRDMPLSNLVQADLPDGALALEAVGSAPGFAIDVGTTTMWCVPGVPRELQVMVERDVIPALRRRTGQAATVSRVVRTAGMAEAAVGEACAPLVARLEKTGNPTIAFLASRGETRVRITAKAATRGEAFAATEPIVEELLGVLGANVTGIDDEGVEAAVARQLRRLGLTLATAESVTGGGVGARLVTVPGASDWYRGGLTVYATDTKTALGGVDPHLLDAHGPVAEETAAALADSVRSRVGADAGLAVVGNAGPTAQGSKPVGYTCVAVALPGESPAATSRTLPARARDELQAFAASMALDFLRRRLAALA